MNIIIPSCHKYSDTWDTFHYLLNKYWPGHPQEVLFTDVTKDKWPGKVAYQVGSDWGWSANLEFNLKRLNEEYVLMLLDDFWLLRDVDEKKIYQAISLMKRDKNIICTRLFPCPGPDEPLNENFGIVNKTAPYRISTQGAIWRTDALLHICNAIAPYTSAWDFEILGTQRIQNYGTVLSAHRHITYPIDYHIAIYRGKWSLEAISIMKTHKINIDTSIRGVVQG